MYKNTLVILGAGGHSRVVIDVARACGWIDFLVFDDDPNVVCDGSIQDLLDKIHCYSNFFVAIGSNEVRSRYFTILESFSVEIVTLVHPSSIIMNDVSISKGTLISPGVILNSNVSIGSGSIVNTGSIIEHDSHIGNFVHVSPGAVIAGSCYISDYVWVCTGVSVINNINVGANAIIGAGAVVIHDVFPNDLVVGVPARSIIGAD